MGKETRQIGWYNLREEKEYVNTYECAAWYEAVNVQPGRYPVFVYDFKISDHPDPKYHNEVDGSVGSAWCELPGTIVSDYFATMYCGVEISPYDEHKNAGKESSHNLHTYLYSMADSILNDPDTPWELLPEFEAREIRFIYDGVEHSTHGIFYKRDQP